MDGQGRDRYRRCAIAIGIADLVKPWHYRKLNFAQKLSTVYVA